MIIALNHRLEKTAKEIRKIQQSAYRIEAELMGFDGIPQLNESVLEIQNADEIFLGHTGNPLKGFLSYKEIGHLIDIHRLAVAPEYFRQGIASDLLEGLFQQFEGRDFLVSTGAANEPAKKLYRKYGFEELRVFEPEPGIWCAEFMKSR